MAVAEHEGNAADSRERVNSTQGQGETHREAVEVIVVVRLCWDVGQSVLGGFLRWFFVLKMCCG